MRLVELDWGNSAVEFNELKSLMTKYRKLMRPSRYLRTLIALKLREIEHDFETYELFVQATGLNNSMVFKLLRGQQNVTSDSIETLAENLRINIWELLNAPGYSVNGEWVENLSVDHEQIKKALKSPAPPRLDKLKGGERKDWLEVKAKRAEMRQERVRAVKKLERAAKREEQQRIEAGKHAK